MSTAKVQVLHAALTSKGWLQPDPEPVPMDASEARALELRGYVDVLEVDGKSEVWAPCCNGGEHDHA